MKPSKTTISAMQHQTFIVHWIDGNHFVGLSTASTGRLVRIEGRSLWWKPPPEWIQPEAKTTVQLSEQQQPELYSDRPWVCARSYGSEYFLTVFTGKCFHNFWLNVKRCGFVRYDTAMCHMCQRMRDVSGGSKDNITTWCIVPRSPSDQTHTHTHMGNLLASASLIQQPSPDSWYQ